MWRLNPLQWSFGPRTTATLLTWAMIPLGLGLFVGWRSLLAGADQAGMSPEQFQQLTASAARNLVFVTVPVLVICLGAAILFSLVIVQPLWRLRKAMELVAQGDLSRDALPAPSRDEVGEITRSFNAMCEALRAMVRDVAETTGELDQAGNRMQGLAVQTAASAEASTEQIEQVSNTAAAQSEQAAGGSRAAEDLRQAAEQVAVSADAQSHEVERVATTVNEVAAAIQQVAASAGVLAEAAGNTRSAADGGARSVDAVVAGMKRVRDRVLAAAGQVEGLSESLHQVDGILGLITEIADQTDLLALNAAIEAARVGEHGKGFAVVAGEVRRLAERSRRAAADISDRVAGLRKGAQGVVTTMEAGTGEVQVGTRLAQEAGTGLQRILEAVEETQRQIESISAASEEISAASTNVVEATHHLSAIAEENAATASQMLSSARSVAELVSAVEAGARSNQVCSGAMAGATEKVRTAVDETVACAGQVSATSTRLRETVGRFQLTK
jgi:methyl-accepting chemotaxis protein